MLLLEQGRSADESPRCWCDGLVNEQGRNEGMRYGKE